MIVLDPMLATGNSAIAAVDRLKEAKVARHIKMLCLLAAPEGIEAFHAVHPEVAIYNPQPLTNSSTTTDTSFRGSDDAGDRLYGTKKLIHPRGLLEGISS